MRTVSGNSLVAVPDLVGPVASGFDSPVCTYRLTRDRQYDFPRHGPHTERSK